jgi:membrane fusion protein, heavy metal efflux system
MRISYLLLMLGFSSLLPVLSVFGHGDEPHPDTIQNPPPSVSQKAASELALVQRLFLPKGEQFQYGLSTTLAKEVDHPKTHLIPGKIIASPSGYAQIHVPQIARVIFDEKFPIPNTGEKVEVNQVLAVVEPLLSAVDLTDKKSELYKVEGEIATLKRDIDRLTKLGEFAIKKDLENKKTDLERAEKQKEQLLTTGLGRDLIRSPISGIVSDNHLLPGQILQPNEPVMEIVNPEHFRVEAYTFDYLQANQILSARVRSLENLETFYDLTLIGTSPRAGEKDQARHILFSLKDPAKDLIIGMPIDVFLTTKETVRRIIIPKKALFKLEKSYSVFILAEPELLVARVVQVGMFFDDSVEIISGLKSGDKFITDVASLSRLISKGEEASHVH